MSFKKSNGFLAAAFLLSVSATNLFAQQSPSSEGIVRITDGRSRSNIRQTAGQNVMQTSACPNGACQNGVTADAGAAAGAGAGTFGPAGCPTGNCPADAWGNGYGGGYCPGNHCRGGHGCFGKGCFCEHYCKHSPDYGYSPPAKYPLQRRGVEYQYYYPAQWYGAGGDYLPATAPMVYSPTDTTQLGFYYQHVPFWQPMPDRLPPRPIPAQWHITPPAVEASGFCRNGLCRQGYGYGNYAPYAYGGTVISTDAGVSPTPVQTGSPTPATSSDAAAQGAPAVEAAPQTTPQQSPAPLPPDNSYDQGAVPSPLPSLSPNATTTPVRPLPNNSAASNHIRRISYKTAR